MKNDQVDWNEDEITSQFPTKLFCGIFGGISALALTISTVSIVQINRNLARELSASGKVVDVVKREELRTGDRRNGIETTVKQDYYYPVVEFKLPNGQQKTVQMSEGSWPAAYEKGESVTVLYPPDKPIKARIRSASSSFERWILPMITGLLGVAFLIPAVAVYQMSKPQRSTLNF